MPVRHPASAADVTAVLVAHDGARWLPVVLDALAALTVRPRHLLAVDTGSRDGSGDLLRAALGDDRVRTLPRDTGYGAAVSAALEAAPAARWVWLLHDDAAPAPDALAALLAHAEQAPSAAVLGPKVHDWTDPRVLVEVGVTTDWAGHRTTRLERREYDQGQHDTPRDVLAVGTAGALVRRDVWDALGGLDPALPVFRDELDLGWRVNAAGHRVVVVPAAEVRHARATLTGRRAPGAASGPAAAVDRQHALLVLLAHASRRRLPFAVVELTLGTLLRALGLLLTRRVGAARDELAALLHVLARPRVLGAARRSRAAMRTVPPDAIRPLLAPRRARLRARADAVARSLGRGPGGDDRSLRSLLRQPPALLVLALAVVALVAERSLLVPGGGVLVGGQLLAVPDGATDLWAAYAASWHDVAGGTPAPAPPVLAVLGLLSTLLLGKPWLAVDLLLLGSVPLAGLTAYLAARRVVASPLLRVWAAATWALLPVATGAVAGGRLDVAVVQVALPLLLLAGHRLLRNDPRGRWHLSFATGLGLAAVTAFAPLLWPLAAVVLAGGGLVGVLASAPAHRAGAWRRAGAAAVAAAVPPVLLLPWSLEVLRAPGLLLHGPAPVAAGPGPADPELPAWSLLLLSPGGPGLPPAWIAAGLVLAALAGLVRRWRSGLALTGWALGLLGLLAALVLARSTADAPTGAADVAVWPAIPLQVAAAGLLLAALVAADRLPQRLARTSFGWPQVTAGLLAAAAAALPVLAAVTWMLRGADDPLRRTDTPSPLPAFVSAELGTEPGLRALVLAPRRDGAVGYELVSADPTRVGGAAVPPDDAALAELDAVVADLLTPSGTDAAGALATRAVRYVALRPGPGADRAAAVLDTQPGLARRSDDPVPLWEVLHPTARLTVLPPALAEAATSGERAPDPALLRDSPPVPLPSEAGAADVPPGEPGRLLVLAEAADGGWRAEVDGEALPRRTAYGWAQAFVLPADGGRLELDRDSTGRRVTLVLQALAVGVVAVLAVPGERRRRGLEPGSPDDRAGAAPGAVPDRVRRERPGRHAAPRRGEPRLSRRSP